MKVVINVANVSKKMSGETVLPLYYFNRFRERGVQVWVVCHRRCYNELRELFPQDEDFNCFHFFDDAPVDLALYQFGQQLPYRVQDLLIGQLHNLVLQRHARRIVQEIIQQENIDLVFEPTPISPKAVSGMAGLTVPLVIGPLCGGLEFPPAFRFMDSQLTHLTIGAGRMAANVGNWLLPGKLQADSLIVGNAFTKKALPKGCRGKIYEVEESGVDLSLWQSYKPQQPAPGEPVRFVFFARFVDWKGVQFLVEAFQQIANKTHAVLELIGDGPLLESTKLQVERLGLTEHVNFYGRLPLEDSAKFISQCHVYMVPSLRECGGNAILEVMAMGLPVVAANWAGPGLFVNQTCGLLVDPSSHQGFVDGLAAAMLRLANDAELRVQLGQGARQRVQQNYYSWDAKVDRVLEIFQETLQRRARQSRSPVWDLRSAQPQLGTQPLLESAQPLLESSLGEADNVLAVR
jgi:glycosyltransferase involved in cell wall biosynthesis